MNTQIDHSIIIEEIKKIITNELPLFWHHVHSYRMLGGNFVAIKIACADYLINNVEGQRPQAVSLCLDLLTLELYPQVFGGNGGQRIERKIDPNNPDEKYLAMQCIKVPFRKPKQDLDSIYKAIAKFCINYKKTLSDNLEQLLYKDVADYNKLLGL